MKKSFLRLAAALLTVASMSCVVSCSCSNDNDATEATDDDDEKVEARTTEVSVFESLPVKGRDAEYFTFTGENGSNTVKLTGTPDDDSYTPSGIIRAEIELTVTKMFPDKVHDLTGYPQMALVVLDEDKEELGTLEMSDKDRDVIIAELAKATPGTIKINYKDKFYGEKYNKIFNNAKYVCIETAEIRGESEYHKSDDTSASAESAYSDSSDDNSSYTSDDDDNSDDDEETPSKGKQVREKLKEKYSDTKEKVKEKYHNLKDKTLDKLNEWLDR